MKFTVNREKLQKALQRVSSIIRQQSFTLMSNVLIEAEDGYLTFITVNGEICISTKIDAIIEEAGATTCFAKTLTSLVGCFSGNNVQFEVDDKDHIELKCETSHFTLYGLPANDFKENFKNILESNQFEVLREVKINSSDFKRMLSSISYAVCVEDNRPVLKGILLSVRESIVTLVATDGKRLAIREKTPESIEGSDGDAVIPEKTISEIRRLIGDDSVITILFGSKQCTFVADGFELTTKLIEGTYPNYRQVVPASFAKTVEINTSTFLTKIETVSQIAASNYINLRFENNRLHLYGSSAEVGEGSDEVEIMFDDEPFEVAFNPSYLLDPLRNADADKIIMKINDPFNPVAIEGSDGFLCIIMPVRKKK